MRGKESIKVLHAYCTQTEFMFKKKRGVGQMSKIFSPVITFLNFSFKWLQVLDHMRIERRPPSSVHKNFEMQTAAFFFFISTEEGCFLSFVAVPFQCHMTGLFLLSC